MTETGGISTPIQCLCKSTSSGERAEVFSLNVCESAQCCLEMSAVPDIYGIIEL